MKSKSKVILGLAAVLAGTVGVAAVSTFAWFTTQNTAQIGFTHAYIQANNAQISVTYSAVTGNGIDSTKDVSTVGNGFNVTATCDVTDISGDGVTFYRPIWTDYPNKVASGFNPYTAIQGHWVEFGATITNDNPTNDVYVYMGANSSVTPVDSSDSNDVKAAACARVAVVDPADSSLISTWQCNADDGVTYQYVKKTDVAEDSAYGVSKYKLISIDTTAVPTWRTGQFVNPTTNDGATVGDGQTVCHLAASGTKTVNFVMWIEGTNPKCLDNIIQSETNMSIELFAINGVTIS
ncbi:MAG: hypothetical protein LKG11_02435 [Bacilli bacterium]|nr:hypothetical protein [Bacilli bacterium]